MLTRDGRDEDLHNKDEGLFSCRAEGQDDLLTDPVSESHLRSEIQRKYFAKTVDGMSEKKLVKRRRFGVRLRSYRYCCTAAYSFCRAARLSGCS